MTRVRDLYSAAGLPIFQNRMYDTAQEAKSCLTGSLRLVEDLRTGLVYNASFDPGRLVYDRNYQNEQAVSPVFRNHLETVARIIKRTMTGRSVIEVGCGKGFFLEMLSAAGINVVGFDPAYEGDNPHVIKGCFEPGMNRRADGIVLRHVLEHIQDPVNFLSQLRETNGGGMIYIEVPCFDWICGHRAWFDVYYEHVNYFRMNDFLRMFDRVYESGKLFGDQYLYVVADLATLRTPAYKAAEAVEFPRDFLGRLESLSSGGEPGGQCAVWGGASKGVLFTLLKERRGESVDMVIDINPAKQGKYLPVTGLAVLSPEVALPRLRKGSLVYVMNSIYLDEIRRMSGNGYNYVGVDYE